MLPDKAPPAMNAAAPNTPLATRQMPSQPISRVSPVANTDSAVNSTPAANSARLPQRRMIRRVASAPIR